MSGSERPEPGGRPARETAASVLPGAPRVAALDALLREVDGLRLTLETDLTLAAAAVESGAPGLAGELVDGDLRHLQQFQARALGHLEELAADEQPAVVVPLRRRRRVRVSLAPLAGAAAALVAVLGLLPAATSAEQPAPTAAMSSWNHLTRLAGADASSGQLRTAALRWHAEVAGLVARAATDPAAARQALVLLQAEQHVLAGQNDPAALGPVIAQSRALADRLRAALPAAAATPLRTALSAVPRVPVPRVVPPTAAPRPQPSRAAAASPSSARRQASPTPTPAPAPAPAPEPEPSTTSQAPSPRPSAPPSGSPRPGPLELDAAQGALSRS